MSATATYCCVRHSASKDWRGVIDFVHDTIADVMHHRAVLAGATPQLTLLLSRPLLMSAVLTESALLRHARALSDDLARRGVHHAIDLVARGNTEPTRHAIRIRLSQS